MHSDRPSTTTITISGMRCAGCVEAVTRALEGVSGVEDCHVELETGVATLSGTAATANLLAAVREAGFEA